MNWIDYREQIGIGFDDNKKLQMCINRIKNLTRIYNVPDREYHKAFANARSRAKRK